MNQQPKYATGNTTASGNVAITIAAVSGVRHAVNHIAWSLNADPTDVVNTKVTVESPSATVLWGFTLTAKGPGSVNLPGGGIRGAEGEALVVRLGGKDNLIGHLSALQVS